MPVVAHVFSASIRRLEQEICQDLKVKAGEKAQYVKHLPCKRENTYLVGKALNLKVLVEKADNTHTHMKSEAHNRRGPEREKSESHKF